VSTRSNRVPTTRAGLAFLAGVVLGGLLVWPAVPDLVAMVPTTGSLGSVGAVLIAGSLALIVFVTGLFALYFGFLWLGNRL
jgi:uncharacterized RDD family membrane protein YckC